VANEQQPNQAALLEPFYDHKDATSLYYGRDMRDIVVKPIHTLSQLSEEIFSHPLSLLSYTSMGKVASANLALTARLTKRFSKPRWGIDTVTSKDGSVYKITPRTVLYKNFCQLLYLRREKIMDGKTRHGAPEKVRKVLIIAPYSGHHATLLRDTVAKMLEEHEVYVTDWDNARDVPLYKGTFHLSHYIDYLMSFMRLLGSDLHVVAVCQAAVPALAAVALLSDDNSLFQPLSLTLIGGPIDTSKAQTPMVQLAQEKPIEWFEHSVVGQVPVYYQGAWRRVVPGFVILAGFMYPHFEKHMIASHEFFNHLILGDEESAKAHRTFYDEYRSVLDLPADYFLDTVKCIFRDNQMARGTLRWHGEKVNLKAIRKTALMTIEGGKDDISGVGPTRAAHDLCTRIPIKKRGHYLSRGVGHYGVFNGRRWRQHIYPRLASFIEKQSNESSSL
jgi:poly(3-hydroxybutyrate) depolymerase